MALKVSKRSDIPNFRALAILSAVNERIERGEDIIRLEAGQPCFGAPKPAIEYAKQVLDNDGRQGYTAAIGMPLLVHGEVADGEVTYHCMMRWSMTGAGLTVGHPDPLPPADDPGARRRFSGTIDTVVIDVSGPAHVDPETEVATALSAQ